MSVVREKVNSEVALQIFFYDVFRAEPERRAGSGRGSRPLPLPRTFSPPMVSTRPGNVEAGAANT